MFALSFAANTRLSSSVFFCSRKSHKRSASLMTTARTSSTIASSIRRILSTLLDESAAELLALGCPKPLIAAICFTPWQSMTTSLLKFSVTKSFEISLSSNRGVKKAVTKESLSKFKLDKISTISIAFNRCTSRCL